MPTQDHPPRHPQDGDLAQNILDANPVAEYQPVRQTDGGGICRHNFPGSRLSDSGRGLQGSRVQKPKWRHHRIYGDRQCHHRQCQDEGGCNPTVPPSLSSAKLDRSPIGDFGNETRNSSIELDSPKRRLPQVEPQGAAMEVDSKTSEKISTADEQHSEHAPARRDLASEGRDRALSGRPVAWGEVQSGTLLDDRLHQVQA